MKILLGIFCGLMVLFAGGCALILVAEGTYPSGGGMVPLAAFPAAVAALNVLVLAALFGKAPRRWAFFLLAVLDGIAALALLIIWVATGFADSAVNVFAVILIGAIALKGIITVAVARKLGSGQ